MKVLILQNKLLHYRIPVFNLLSERPGIDLTVAHPGTLAKEAEINFRQIALEIARTGPFVIHTGLYKLCCEYHVVIAMFDLRWLTHMKLALKRHRPFRLIYWGIGVSTESGFDSSHLFDSPRFFFARKADGLLLYSEQAKQKYLAAKFPQEKLFVAHNSVDYFSNNSNQSDTNKDSFIFVGSLNKRKKLEELIEAFRITLSAEPCNLVIVGEGSEKEKIESLVINHELKDCVKLTGHIDDLDKLETYFKRALASVSPGQAGLSVLRSFSFGVPFICNVNAITGGERFDIKDDYNGYQYSGGSMVLAKLMTKLVQNPDEARRLGHNAKNFYLSSRTLDHMINGFIKAINSA